MSDKSPDLDRLNPEEAEPSAALAPYARKRRRSRATPAEKEWYSKSEAARYLGIAEITVSRYLQKGVLQGQRLPTAGKLAEQTTYDYGRLRIHRSELDRYLESIDRNRQAPAGTTQVGEGTLSNGENMGARTFGVDTEVMTREEAALRLGVSWRTIKRYIESGKLRLAGYFRCPDSYTRAHVYRSEVDELLQGNPRMDAGQVE